jgi:hypothetical protein
MDNVEFSEENYNQDTNFNTPKTPTMVKWIMKIGFIKNETQANILLLVIAIVFFALAIIIF